MIGIRTANAEGIRTFSNETWGSSLFRLTENSLNTETQIQMHLRLQLF